MPRPVHFISSVFDEGWKTNWSLIGLIGGVAVLQMALLILASWIDGTWHLPGVGKGLGEHYGVWAIVVTDPLLLLSTAAAYRHFVCAMKTLPLSPKVERQTTFNEVIRPKMDRVLMKGHSIYAYFIAVVFGVLGLALNIKNTSNPGPYFGNDVFDSTAYTYGFIVNKINLALSWIVVYPLVAYVIIVMSVSLYLILRELLQKNALKGYLAHPDQCYGFSRLGTLNIFLVIPYFLTYEVMFFLSVTHEVNYLSLIVPLVLTTILFLAASFLIIFPLVRYLSQQNEKQLGDLEGHIEELRNKDEDPPTSFMVKVLLFTGVRTSPYSKHAATAIIALRLIPIGMTIYKLFNYPGTA